MLFETALSLTKVNYYLLFALFFYRQRFSIKRSAYVIIVLIYERKMRQEAVMSRRIVKQIIASIVVLCLTVSMLQASVLADDTSGQDTVTYIKRSWNGSKVAEEKVNCDTYNVITSDTGSLGSGVYVVGSNITNDHRITVSGDADLILQDGARLELTKGIYVASGSTLSIYGGQADSGRLVITSPGDDNAGIGGADGRVSGKIVIHGGDIDVTGGNEAAGIGGGNGKNSGFEEITIYGGKINSSAKRDAAGIGSGFENKSKLGKILIYGGEVNATGKQYGSGIGGGYKSGFDEIIIYGGDVMATSDGSAGIGSGAFCACRNITINGGFIQASGRGGAGIGAGFNSDQSGVIEINDGVIEAASSGGTNALQEFGGGAGIGGSYSHSSGKIIINGGHVFASAVAGAGIGGGEGGNCGNIEINGGDIYAVSRNYGAGIGGGKNGGGGTITISGGTVTACGCDYEYGVIEAWCDNGTDMVGMKYYQSVVAFVGDFFTGVTISGSYSGAGIGGGYKGSGAAVSIKGGEVTAQGGDNAAAIGHGQGSSNNGSFVPYPTACVYVNGNLVECSDRISKVSSSSKVTIRECEHDGFIYTPTADGSGHEGDCKYCEYHIIKEPHEMYYYSCDKCKYVDHTYLQWYSATLSGDIGMNFHVSISDEVLNNDLAYARVTLPNGDVNDIPMSSIRNNYSEYEGVGYYTITGHIAAKEMTDYVTLQIFSGDYRSTIYRFSFDDYVVHIMNSVSSEECYKAQPLIKALITYGGYVQQYFGYNLDNLASDHYFSNFPEPLPKNLNIEHDAPVVYQLPKGITFEGASLILKSETKLALYFRKKGNVNAVFKYNGQDLTPVKSGGYLKVTIDNIKAYDLDKDFTINVGEGYVTYSPMNYCQTVLAGDYDDSLKNVIKSLYKYYVKAVEYYDLIHGQDN